MVFHSTFIGDCFAQFKVFIYNMLDLVIIEKFISYELIFETILSFRILRAIYKSRALL